MAKSRKLQKVDARMKKLFKGKRWMQDLNILFLDDKSIIAFGHLLTELELLRSQVEGLEENINKIK